MGNAPNNWQILGSEQRPPRRRDEVLKEIMLALVTNNGAGVDSKQCGGFDLYDHRLGSAQRDVWGKKRRA
jgi:hypothetical protein